jgi:hypothetical protein
MSGKKYKGPLPKSKMTKAQRDANNREAGAGRLGEQDQKMMYGGKVKGFDNGGLAKTTEMSPEILETIREIEKSGKTFKPEKMEPDKPISDKDIESLKKLMKPANFFDGGEVRGMGKAYQGGKRSCKVR